MDQKCKAVRHQKQFKDTIQTSTAPDSYGVGLERIKQETDIEKMRIEKTVELEKLKLEQGKTSTPI